MAVTATTGHSRTVSAPPDSTKARLRGADALTLRAELRRDYEGVYERTCRRDTLDALEAIVPWLARCYRVEGEQFIRSNPQAYKGIGWETVGKVRADRQRHRNQLANRLDMLVAMGWIESWEAIIRPGGRGVGILVRVGERRVSSVGQAHRRRPGPQKRRQGAVAGHVQGKASPPPARRDECAQNLANSEEVAPPYGERLTTTATTTTTKTATAREAVARARAGDTRRRPPRAADVAVALRSHWSRIGEEAGVDTVLALPWLVDVEPSTLARAAWIARADDPSTGLPKHFRPVISAERQAQLAAAVERCDRYANHRRGQVGAGAGAVLDFIAGDWRETGKQVPYSLGCVAVGVDRQSKLWRRHDRARRPRRLKAKRQAAR